MCTGTALLYKIPRVVVGENQNFRSSGEKWFLERNVQMQIVQNEECIKLMKDFIEQYPDLWQEDIHDV